jgi:UDPglucose 6-dehydrogenase
LKSAIASTGFVGLSEAILLGQHHQVMAFDIMTAKVGGFKSEVQHLQTP